MIDFYNIPSEELPMTMKALQQRAKERSWPKIEKLYHPGPSILFATRPDGKEIRIFASVPPTSIDFSCKIARDKLATFHLLKTANIITRLKVLGCLIMNFMKVLMTILMEMH